ncbi:hypothetical protein BBP40_000501 [Aspergillus hancockii]|nr:hypothetical protein BBP40_000501 [Aspergillus hancockii]
MDETISSTDRGIGMLAANDLNMFFDADFNEMLRSMDENMATTNYLPFDLDSIFPHSEASSTHIPESVLYDNEDFFQQGLSNFRDGPEEPQKANTEEEGVEFIGG